MNDQRLAGIPRFLKEHVAIFLLKKQISALFYSEMTTKGVAGRSKMLASSSSSSYSSVENEFQEQRSEYKDKLMGLLKKEVKHLMEESVMLKCIHEDSATVTALCSVIDNCLSLGEWKKKAELRLKVPGMETFRSIFSWNWSLACVNSINCSSPWKDIKNKNFFPYHKAKIEVFSDNLFW